MSSKNQYKKVESPRAKTVAAAIGLVTLPKAVPYGFKQSEYVGRWMKKGFFLEVYDDDKGGIYRPWGCMVKVSPQFPRNKIQGLGDEYANGLTCSRHVG